MTLNKLRDPKTQKVKFSTKEKSLKTVNEAEEQGAFS